LFGKGQRILSTAEGRMTVPRTTTICEAGLRAMVDRPANCPCSCNPALRTRGLRESLRSTNPTCAESMARCEASRPRRLRHVERITPSSASAARESRGERALREDRRSAPRGGQRDSGGDERGSCAVLRESPRRRGFGESTISNESRRASPRECRGGRVDEWRPSETTLSTPFSKRNRELFEAGRRIREAWKRCAVMTSPARSRSTKPACARWGCWWTSPRTATAPATRTAAVRATRSVTRAFSPRAARISPESARAPRRKTRRVRRARNRARSTSAVRRGGATRAVRERVSSCAPANLQGVKALGATPNEPRHARRARALRQYRVSESARAPRRDARRIRRARSRARFPSKGVGGSRRRHGAVVAPGLAHTSHIAVSEERTAGRARLASRGPVRPTRRV
jgi:hypothetical protein